MAPWVTSAVAAAVPDRLTALTPAGMRQEMAPCANLPVAQARQRAAHDARPTQQVTIA